MPPACVNADEGFRKRKLDLDLFGKGLTCTFPLNQISISPRGNGTMALNPAALFQELFGQDIRWLSCQRFQQIESLKLKTSTVEKSSETRLDTYRARNTGQRNNQFWNLPLTFCFHHTQTSLVCFTVAYFLRDEDFRAFWIAVLYRNVLQRDKQMDILLTFSITI